MQQVEICIKNITFVFRTQYKFEERRLNMKKILTVWYRKSTFRKYYDVVSCLELVAPLPTPTPTLTPWKTKTNLSCRFKPCKRPSTIVINLQIMSLFCLRLHSVTVVNFCFCFLRPSSWPLPCRSSPRFDFGQVNSNSFRIDFKKRLQGLYGVHPPLIVELFHSPNYASECTISRLNGFVCFWGDFFIGGRGKTPSSPARESASPTPLPGEF